MSEATVSSQYDLNWPASLALDDPSLNTFVHTLGNNGEWWSAKFNE